MKKLRIVCSFVLCLALLAGFFTFGAQAATARDLSFEETLAADLKALNLFRGYNDTDFGLYDAPDRVQALVMLIRILGQEKTAEEGEWTHPFTDVPEWADKYVGYAYETGLTNGSSPTEFGTGPASAAMYLTFMLRALGYSDAEGGDFTWDRPYTLAYQAGILPGCVDTDEFLRADVVSVSYAALGNVMLKDGSMTLTDRLVAAGVFTREDFDAVYRTGVFTDFAETNGYELVHFEWYALDDVWTYDLWMPLEAVEYYKSLPRDPYSFLTEYSSYVYEEDDDEYLHALAVVFIQTAADNGWDNDAAVELVIGFVQGLQYLSDDPALGYDYPKYPIETLYDGGGDCEDLSILLVSFLREMGYGCALISFEDHMGVGILGEDDIPGWYYVSDGDKYYYIETTDVGWMIGEMPEDLIYATAVVWPF